MNKKLFASLLMAGVLAGCAPMPKSHQATEVLPFQAKTPQVYVSDGRIIVDQEPIVIPRDVPVFEITWELRSPNARFARFGVTIDSLEKFLQPDGNPAKADKAQLERENARLKAAATDPSSIFTCHPQSDIAYTCRITTAGLPHGLYAYTIRLIVNGKPLELDPRFLL